jgi:tetratricopeptide (TPR) repeat protein
LKRDVAAMMADASREDSVLAQPAWELLGLPAGDDPMYRLPATIGAYRIIRIIGDGGMGVVYEAEQDEPRRTVALKVIKPGLSSAEVLRRFRQEAQALARLQHPGIAQIYEAGTADTGDGPQPYFAMEFIRGEVLTDYVRSRNLSVRDRLEVVARVSDAVDHAHQRGLIHRDLKPANILVNEGGQPKVLDFGVARLIDSDVHLTQHTNLGQLVGTLAYMSPEQVLADPLALDIRSDVYSLGVIMHELLAGSLPYELSRKLHEAIHTIQHEDPQRLSSISRTYRGDVETIAAKALEKDKARRYGSAGALAADIRRFLHDEPITARPASATYQARKFATRHKALVGGVVAVFIALAAGVVATTRETMRARQAEDKARRAEETAQAVNSFLQEDLLAQASTEKQGGPSVKPDPDIKVRTALDRAAGSVGTKFKDRPMVEASIRQTLGRTYRDLGLYPEAQAHLERAYEIAKNELGEDHEELLPLLDDLASVYYFRAQYSIAIPLVEKLAGIKSRMLGPEHTETLTALNNLGLVHTFAGDDRKAEEILRPVVETRRRVSGDKHPESLTAMANLAQVLQRRAKLKEAEPLFLRTIEVSREVKGEEHPSTLSAMNNLSQVYRDQGRLGDAERVLSQTLEIRRRVLTDEHPNTLTTINNLSNIQLDAGKIAEAEAAFTKLLDVRRRVIGENHPNTLMTLNNLARVYRFKGDYARAEALLRQASEAQKRYLGVNHPDTLLVLSNLGFLYYYAGRYADAQATLEKVLAVRREVSGPDHPDTLTEIERLGLVAQARRQFAKAEELLGTVLELRRKSAGDQHRDTLRAGAELGLLYLEQRKHADAARVLGPTLEGYKATNPEVWQRYSTQALLGISLAAQAKPSEAEPLLVGSYEGLVKVRPTIPQAEIHFLDDAARSLADLYRTAGQADRADEWARKATAAVRRQ